MGYHSDVAIVIKGRKNLVVKELTKLKLLGKAESIIEAIDGGVLEPVNYPTGKKFVRFAMHFVGIKWYRGDPFVEAVMAVYANFEKDTSNFSGEFIRVGEESDDIERMQFGLETGTIWTETIIKWDEGEPDRADDIRKKPK